MAGESQSLIILDPSPRDENAYRELCENLVPGNKLKALVFPVDPKTLNTSSTSNADVAVVTFFSKSDADAFIKNANDRECQVFTKPLPKQVISHGRFSLDPDIKDSGLSELKKICKKFGLRCESHTVSGEWFRIQALCNLLYNKDERIISCTTDIHNDDNGAKSTLFGDEKYDEDHDTSFSPIKTTIEEKHSDVTTEEQHSQNRSHQMSSSSSPITTNDTPGNAFMAHPVLIMHIMKKDNNLVKLIADKYKVNIQPDGDGVLTINGDDKRQIEQAKKRLDEGVKVLEPFVKHVSLLAQYSVSTLYNICENITSKYPQLSYYHDKTRDQISLVSESQYDKEIEECAQHIKAGTYDDKPPIDPKVAAPSTTKRQRKLADQAKPTHAKSPAKVPVYSKNKDEAVTPQASPQSLGSFDSGTPHQSFKFRSSPIQVHSLLYDITTMSVDVIVNAANERLQHGAGVARAIADAAGYNLVKDCNDYISQHGQLQVTGTYFSTAGNLPCKTVLHTVGPVYNRAYHQACCEQLLNTVVNCLKSTCSKKFTSIAIPAISSGIFGFPNDLVAQIIVNAVARFLSVYSKQTSIQDVYLVDVRPHIIALYDRDLHQRNDFDTSAFTKKAQHFPQKRAHSHTPGHAPSADKVVSTLDGSYRQRNKGQGTKMGPSVGTQPTDGTMDFSVIKEDLPGFPGTDTIQIKYTFPSGVQTTEHPHPGKPYRGTTQMAYLPNTKDGLKVLGLLQQAFCARLLFRIGRPTKGQADTVLWADIEHKTQTRGGKSKYGYPDDNYLRNVTKQLHANGIYDTIE